MTRQEIGKYLQRRNHEYGRVLFLSAVHRYVYARCKMLIFLILPVVASSVGRDRRDGRKDRARLSLFRIFSFLSRKTLYLFVLEARVKWLTALLVQHYEGFHPDLVALNRQPTGNQTGGVLNIEEKLIAVGTLSRLAPQRSSTPTPKKEKKLPPAVFASAKRAGRNEGETWDRKTRRRKGQRWECRSGERARTTSFGL